MSNVSGKAYGLTVLCPIKPGHTGEIAYSDEVKCRLLEWNTRQNSPMTKVPQTYLCRYFVLDDVFTEALAGAEGRGTWLDVFACWFKPIYDLGLPREEHLKSRYLVFSSNFHGDLDAYLRGMWNAIGEEICRVWEYCYAFEQVCDADSFIAYMKKCQLDVSLFFVGSTDDPLEEQLKSLYLKQEFAHFVLEHQGMEPARLQAAFKEFIARVKPRDVKGPSWSPGQYKLGRQWEVA
ncbi:MAG TPA: hypothetical protein VEC06_08125 [Paucimonas sp.]|nr:hypothetical protein [Paucimonas sp.]